MNDLKSGMINKLIWFFVILLIVLGVEIIFIYRFNKSYQADFSHFADFFQRGKGKYEKINIDRLHFSEFKKMGVIANEMIEERVRIHEKLVQEQKKVLESDRLKTAFLANMSHEIRTPMNAIIGFSQLLDDESISREDRKAFLQLILQNGELLINLINDIIDIAKIESGQLNVVKREFKLSNLLDNINIYYQEYISGKPKMKIRFQMEKNIPDHFICNSDQFRLKQVLDNLIGNAIKFTAVGVVKLIVSESNGKVYFQVMDTGIGISEEDQRLIFNRFIQAKDHIWKNYGGTGLGLAISKNIVELLGGEIGVRSAPGKGSEFYFYIPGSEGKPEV
ncbi:MAG: sensor histidine kinase [Mangrovibacterium sp.]